jgi:hypothetical protein
MPNQRHKDKVIVSVYIPSELKAELRAEARRRGVPVSVIVTEFYVKGLQDRGMRINEKGERHVKRA